jgi:segregation and condensation protein B
MDEHEEREKQQPEEELGLESLSQPESDGLSLDDLSAAYAQLIEGGVDSPPQAEASDSEDEDAGEPELEEEDPGEEAGVDPRSILEAILFVGNPDSQPLTSRQVAAFMRGVTPDEIDRHVEELNAKYEAESCPYQVVSTGPGYLLQLREEFAALRDRFYGRVREAHLSQAAVDVLAMVAYRQPMTRDQVNSLRSKPSGAVLSQLVRRQLLRIERSEEQPRNPSYYTTDRFLDLFGLGSIEELPQSQEIDKNI